MSDRLFEKSRLAFIGKPLKSLYQHHTASRNRFVLFLERKDGGVQKLGEDFNLSALILKRKVYADHTIVSIERRYNEIHITVRMPEGENNAGE